MRNPFVLNLPVSLISIQFYCFRHCRGRGRGHRGSRGRSFSDDGRDAPEGGRGTYSNRGYYSENRGGYHGPRGGRGMGRGGYAAQDRTNSSQSSDNTSDRHATDNSHLGIRGASGGIHVSSDRRDIHAGSNVPGANSGENLNYAGHSTHGEGRSQGNISSAGGSSMHSHSTKFNPAPEFEMKGNDFPALPGAGESVPRKASESSDGASAWGEANRYVLYLKYIKSMHETIKV